MAINFDAAPDAKPAQGSDIPKGTYLAKIESAEMKQGQNTAKPPYLLLKLKITDPESGISLGTIFDNITESESSYVQYKAKRLAKACGFDLSGEVELSDLAKLVNQKELKVDVTVQEDKEKNTKKSVVDIFSGEIFYPLEDEAADVFVLEPETQDEPAAAAPTPEAEQEY